jgi:serine/threonine protein kinase
MLPGDRVLDRFEIVTALARNAERPSTFRVRDLHHDRTAILKMVRTSDAVDDPLQDEVELLRAIPPTQRAAHIAPLLDSGHDGETLWMLTEDVGEVHVGQHLRQRPDIGMPPRLGFDEVLDLLEAIGTALACLGDHRVLHLDVKEANIVVDPGAVGVDRYWLVDLGIGRQLREGRSTATADLRGTLDGVAPELLHPSRQVGPAADVYALCAVALRCLRLRPQEKWPAVRADQLATCGLLPGEPRHTALLSLLLRGMDERAQRRPSAAALVRRVCAIRRGRVWHARRLLPLVAISPVLILAGLAITWWITAPQLTFEDVTEAWAIAAAAPDARSVPGHDGISSGFYWYPSVIRPPGRGNLLLHVPRGLRYWGETADELTHDLFAEFVDGRFQWRLADMPEASINTWDAVDVDLDGDGHHDRLMLELAMSTDFEHFAWFGPDPWSNLARSGGQVDLDGETCVPGRVSRGENISGYPLLFPPDLGESRLRVYAGGKARACLMKWSKGGLESEPLPEEMDGAVAWLDLQSDGLLDLVTCRDKTLYSVSLEADGSWTRRPIAGADSRYGLGAVGDVDGDGDEDAVIMTLERNAFLMLVNDRGVLRQRDGVEIYPLDPDEENWESPNRVRLVDLEGDGLPELVMQACGFPRNGASRPKIFRNAGAWQFERVPLPDTLAVPHDATPYLFVDVDQDGLVDLIDLSVNDEHRQVPTHRAWRTRSRSPDRLWPLDLRTPTGGVLPLGTRVQRLGDRTWLHVVRDAGAIPVPSWLAGTLMVQLPAGEIYALHLDEALSGPREVVLERRSPPPLLAAGGVPVLAGAPAPGPERVYYHARRGGLDIRAVRSTGDEQSDRLIVLGPDGETSIDVADLRPGLGCPREDLCLFMEADIDGGLTPLRLDPSTGEVTRLTETGDMTMGAVVLGDRAWVAGDHKLNLRDPETYALLETSPDYDTTLGECHGLAVSDGVIACTTAPIPRLVLYDAASLRELARLVVAVDAPWSIEPVDGGWAVTTEDGLAWIDDDGTVEHVRFGEPLALIPSDDQLWAVGEDRALWFDPKTRQLQGGLVAPGIREQRPTGLEGEHGNH